ncbi:hypothetical protein PHYPSEUDO_010428 [Phytophthora pseudosyringae]|uniref:Uncharacterized protein n=1 Tax=Phytophthora pseudosyringae TaxID=221518 RepID=A0A8T1VB80_9STRA|nr:hypothetical protein PHYPSEUDO_010428 [Phytophthora pseudosyringae]
MYSFVSESWHQFKPCVYIAAFWGFYILVIADVFVRHIFRTETVRGLIASDFKLPENLSRTILIQQQRRHRRFWMPSRRQFVKVYARNLPVMFFSMIAIVYVHAISQFVVLQGQWELFAFASASVALKLCLQELAKKMMIATRKPVSRRAMVTLVATPTILVDTQVRMVLLRQASTNVSVVGTVVLAIFEVLVRAFKSLAVQRQTRGPPTPRDISRRWSTFAKSPPARASTSSTTPLDVMAKPRTASSTLVRTGTALRSRVHSKGETVAQCNARREAEERRQKYRVLHAAEIYSDMYAEYIAIGCSYAILFFYHDHAHFQFSLSALQNRQFGYLGALQMGVEVVVDFLACVVEAAEGVEFKSFDQNDPFLVFLLAVLTFSNVAISAGLYIR